MPLYEYKCDLCGESFDVIQKFSDSPLTVHEGCGGGVQRVIFPSALHFKGTGWYVTDYGHNGNSSSGNGSNGKSESKSSSHDSGAGKSKSKPAPTTSGK
jgi:putative FmdB family regulatory protein